MACLIRLDRLDAAATIARTLPADLPGWWRDIRAEAIGRFAARRARARALLNGRRGPAPLARTDAVELAFALHATGRLGPAARLGAALAAEEPASFAPRDLEARIIARRHGPAAALACLAALPEPVSDDPSCVVRRAQLLFEIGRYRDALDLLSAWPAIADDFFARRMLAFAALLTGERRFLHDHCRRWMTAHAGEDLPAELVCAAHPPPRDRSAGPVPAIAQFWPANDVPPAIKGAMDSWRRRHPAAEHRLFTAATARAFLQDTCAGEAVAAFDRADDGGRAALLRYAWLHHHGGVSVGADRYCVRPAAAFLATCAGASIAAVRSGTLEGPLEAGLVGARRGSPVTAALVQAVTARVLENGALREEQLLTRAVAQHAGDPADGDEAQLFAPTVARRYVLPAILP